MIADASVLIALLEPADVHHDRAVSLLSGIRELIVHPVTLAEVLVGPSRAGVAVQVLADLRAIGVRDLDQRVDHSLLVAEIRARHGLKMPDACVLAAAVEMDLPLLTFDRRLADAARDRALLFGA